MLFESAHFGVPVDSVSTTYYTSLLVQKFDIRDDFINELIRVNDENERFNDRFADNSSRNNSSTGSKSKNKSNYTNGKNQNNDNRINNIVNGKIGENLTTPACAVSPTIVSSSTIITCFVPTVQDIEVTLHNVAGGVMWQGSIKDCEGTRIIECPTENISSGDYIIITRIGSEIFSQKIVKR